MFRYADPATELDVYRLTDPTFASGLTAPHLRQFTRRSDALFYWSERTGSRQIYRLDLQTGQSKQLTDAAALDVKTIALSPDDRYLYFFDGPTLVGLTISSQKPREMHRVPEGSTRTGMTVGADGSVIFAETSAAGSRALRISLQKTAPVFSSDQKIDLVMARPKHAQVLCRAGNSFWLANFDGSGKKQISPQQGITEEELWAPSGRSLIYLHVPEDPKQLITLRENVPEEASDEQIAKTSQFGTFGINTDASVFAGASRSKASAYVLILLRVTKRELTLCEHRASDPAMVSPVFSPDSHSIFFVSDRHGQPAIYRVSLEKFVEETEDQ